jgi:hypothetical protein
MAAAGRIMKNAYVLFASVFTGFLFISSHVEASPLAWAVAQTGQNKVEMKSEPSAYAEINGTPPERATAVANLTGSLAAFAQSQWTVWSAGALGYDEFTLSGSSEFDLTVHLTVRGRLDAAQAVSGAGSMASVLADLYAGSGPPPGFDTTSDHFEFRLIDYTGDPLPVDILVVLSRTYHVTGGVPFGLVYLLSAGTQYEAFADFGMSGITNTPLSSVVPDAWAPAPPSVATTPESSELSELSITAP